MPRAQFFDFGTIPHGQAREHDFVLDVHQELGSGYYPLGTFADCSCASIVTLFRDGAGNERLVTAHGPETAPATGEVMVVRLKVDTSHKEPVDIGPVDSNAIAQFQRVDARNAATRVQWAMTFRYTVDAPVRVRPYAVLDFERVPLSGPRELETTLASDLPDRAVHFGPARCDDPRVQLRLEERGPLTYLHAKLTPRGDDLGNLRTLVAIDTDLDPHYEVRLAVVAQIIPDLVATPIDKISIRADLRHAQDPAKAASQFVLVTDHDCRRPPEFRIARIVDAAGHDASNSFEVTLQPLVGDERSSRLLVRWVGSAESEFRGEIVLAKDPEAGPFLPIQIVALHAPLP